MAIAGRHKLRLDSPLQHIDHAESFKPKRAFVESFHLLINTLSREIIFFECAGAAYDGHVWIKRVAQVSNGSAQMLADL